MSTVRVEKLTDQVVKIIWDKSPSTEDTKRAFNQVTSVLTDSPHPMFVIVDISADPKFPIASTLTSALFGPQMNPKFIAWLVIGSNHAARLIGRTLTGATGRIKVHWFDDESGVHAHINQHNIEAEKSA